MNHDKLQMIPGKYMNSQPVNSPLIIQNPLTKYYVVYWHEQSLICEIMQNTYEVSLPMHAST